MPTIADIARLSRSLPKGGFTRTPLPPTEEETAANPISALLGIPFDAVLKLFDAIDYLGATVRAGVGKAAGVEGIGRETILGKAPSGRQLIGLGEGQKGKFESADIPGFLAELLLDPIMWTGIGAPTKAGLKAARAARLGRHLQAGREIGGEIGRRAVHEAIGGLRGLGYKSLKDIPKAMRLGEQGAKGLRSLISFQPPFSRMNIPLTPRGVSEVGLGGLGKIGHGLARMANPATRRLSNLRGIGEIPIGKVTPKALNDLALWNENIKISQEVGRLAERRSGQAIETMRVGLKQTEGMDLKEAQNLLREAMEVKPEKIQRVIQEATDGYNLTVKTVERTWKKEWDGLGDKIAELDGELAALASNQLTVKGLPNQAILKRATKNRTLREKLLSKQEELGLAAQQKVRKAASARAEKVAKLSISAEDAAKLQATLPKEVAQEADRMRMVLGKQLTAEQQAGLKTALLNDAFLEYFPRVITAESREFTKLLPPDHFLVKYVKEVDEGLGHAATRVAFPHKPVGIANQLWREATRGELGKQLGKLMPDSDEAVKLRGLIERLSDDAKTPVNFFTEDVAEAVMTRASRSAKSQVAAALQSGTISLFAVSKEMAGENAIPVAEAVAKLWSGGGAVPHGLTRIGRKVRGLKTVIPGKKLAPEELSAELAKVRRMMGKASRLEGTPEGEKLLAAAVKKLKAARGEKGALRGVEAFKAQFKGTKLEGKFIPRDVFENLNRVTRVMEDPDSLGPLMKWVDRVNSVYRTSVTAFFPGFHARNALSNGFMCFFAGMRNPTEFAMTAKLQARAARGLLKRGSAEAKLLEDATVFATMGRGWTGEISGLGEKSRMMKYGLQWAAKYPLKAGAALENNAKITLFMWARKKGMTSHEAGELVKKWLFDYEDLSRFEKSWMRRLSFFYTFTRKNIPLMFEEMVLKPRRLAVYGHLTGEVGSRREGRSVLPPWLRDRVPFEWQLDDEGNRVFISTGLPPEDLLRFSTEGRGLQRVLQKVGAFGAPTFKAPLEYMTGTNLATGLTPRPGGGLISKAAERLPMPLRRAVVPLAQAEPLAPTSRLTGSLLRFLETEPAGGERKLGAETLRFITGISPRGVYPPEQQLRNRIRAINIALDRYRAVGDDKTPRTRELRSLRARLSADLRKMK